MRIVLSDYNCEGQARVMLDIEVYRGVHRLDLPG